MSIQNDATRKFVEKSESILQRADGKDLHSKVTGKWHSRIIQHIKILLDDIGIALQTGKINLSQQKSVQTIKTIDQYSKILKREQQNLTNELEGQDGGNTPRISADLKNKMAKTLSSLEKFYLESAESFENNPKDLLEVLAKIGSLRELTNIFDMASVDEIKASMSEKEPEVPRSKTKEREQIIGFQRLTPKKRDAQAKADAQPREAKRPTTTTTTTKLETEETEPGVSHNKEPTSHTTNPPPCHTKQSMTPTSKDETEATEPEITHNEEPNSHTTPPLHSETKESMTRTSKDETEATEPEVSHNESQADTHSETMAPSTHETKATEREVSHNEEPNSYDEGPTSRTTPTQHTETKRSTAPTTAKHKTKVAKSKITHKKEQKDELFRTSEQLEKAAENKVRSLTSYKQKLDFGGNNNSEEEEVIEIDISKMQDSKSSSNNNKNPLTLSTVLNVKGKNKPDIKKGIAILKYFIDEINNQNPAINKYLTDSLGILLDASDEELYKFIKDDPENPKYILDGIKTCISQCEEDTGSTFNVKKALQNASNSYNSIAETKKNFLTDSDSTLGLTKKEEIVPEAAKEQYTGPRELGSFKSKIIPTGSASEAKKIKHQPSHSTFSEQLKTKKPDIPPDEASTPKPKVEEQSKTTISRGKLTHPTPPKESPTLPEESIEPIKTRESDITPSEGIAKTPFKDVRNQSIDLPTFISEAREKLAQIIKQPYFTNKPASLTNKEYRFIKSQVRSISSNELDIEKKLTLLQTTTELLNKAYKDIPEELLELNKYVYSLYESHANIQDKELLTQEEKPKHLSQKERNAFLEEASRSLLQIMIKYDKTLENQNDFANLREALGKAVRTRNVPLGKSKELIAIPLAILNKAFPNGEIPEELVKLNEKFNSFGVAKKAVGEQEIKPSNKPGKSILANSSPEKEETVTKQESQNFQRPVGSEEEMIELDISQESDMSQTTFSIKGKTNNEISQVVTTLHHFTDELTQQNPEIKEHLDEKLLDLLNTDEKDLSEKIAESSEEEIDETLHSLKISIEDCEEETGIKFDMEEAAIRAVDKFHKEAQGRSLEGSGPKQAVVVRPSDSLLEEDVIFTPLLQNLLSIVIKKETENQNKNITKKSFISESVIKLPELIEFFEDELNSSLFPEEADTLLNSVKILLYDSDVLKEDKKIALIKESLSILNNIPIEIKPQQLLELNENLKALEDKLASHKLEKKDEHFPILDVEGGSLIVRSRREINNFLSESQKNLMEIVLENKDLLENISYFDDLLDQIGSMSSKKQLGLRAAREVVRQPLIILNNAFPIDKPEELVKLNAKFRSFGIKFPEKISAVEENPMVVGEDLPEITQQLIDNSILNLHEVIKKFDIEFTKLNDQQQTELAANMDKLLYPTSYSLTEKDKIDLIKATTSLVIKDAEARSIQSKPLFDLAKIWRLKYDVIVFG